MRTISASLGPCHEHCRVRCVGCGQLPMEWEDCTQKLVQLEERAVNAERALEEFRGAKPGEPTLAELWALPDGVLQVPRGGVAMLRERGSVIYIEGMRMRRIYLSGPSKSPSYQFLDVPRRQGSASLPYVVRCLFQPGTHEEAEMALQLSLQVVGVWRAANPDKDVEP